jgi:ribonuclease Z
MTGNRPAYPIVNDVIDAGWSLSEHGFTVDVCPTEHRTESYAYRIREADNPGAFDVEKAIAAGLPSGRLFGQLKAGEVVTLPDGRVVNGADYVGEAKRGRMTVYTGDTRPSDAVVAFATGADLLIHEATFHSSEQAQAEKSAHSTTLEAANVALRAGVKDLVITHFSSRYDADTAQPGIDLLLRDAQSVFPSTRLASDFQRFSIKRPDTL